MEKASMGTAVGHGSVDPKVVIEKNLKKELRPFTGVWEKKKILFLGPKGKRVNIPAPGRSSEGRSNGFKRPLGVRL